MTSQIDVSVSPYIHHSMIEISVITIGFAHKFRFRQGIKVQEVLKKVFDYEFNGYYITVNGVKANRDTILKDKDILIAVTSVKGEATLKSNGKIWRYHKNDPDDIFPSDFHAHNYEDGFLLDIYTGQVFDHNTKMYIGTLKKKNMYVLYMKLKESRDIAISSRCDDDPTKFTFLK